MLCFDKLKIITSIDYINDFNNKYFQSVYKDNILQYYKYQQKQPYSLLIMVNYEHNELVIEFTSKILKDNCRNLININTIQECFININNLNICMLDIDKILNHSEVYKCDITKDIIYHDFKELEKHIKTNLTNYNKWVCKNYKDGFVLENIVGTSRYKKRISVYNKDKELKRANNQSFINSLSNKEDVLSYFNDKIRIEHNINTKSQIKHFLNITDNQLMNVLNSESNPIKAVIDEAVKEIKINTSHNQTIKGYHYELTLKDCNYDLKQVEMKIRSLCSKNTSITKMMKPYKELYYQLQNNIISTIEFKQLIA